MSSYSNTGRFTVLKNMCADLFVLKKQNVGQVFFFFKIFVFILKRFGHKLSKYNFCLMSFCFMFFHKEWTLIWNETRSSTHLTSVNLSTDFSFSSKWKHDWEVIKLVEIEKWNEVQIQCVTWRRKKRSLSIFWVPTGFLCNKDFEI